MTLSRQAARCYRRPMAFSLICHPAFDGPGTESVEVKCDWLPGPVLRLSYIVAGAMDRILLPQPVFGARRDGLWQHSCFEVFIRPHGQDRYYEFNFSPSGEWAAYGFNGYRSGMAEAEAITPPRITTRRVRKKLVMTVDLVPGLLTAWPQWDVGLSAVLEMVDGQKSYWALCHPADAPDFHHGDCFAARLSPTDAP